MFAGKKSAQIREILISESTWEEMTCLFAPSLAEKQGCEIASVGEKFAEVRVPVSEEDAVDDWRYHPWLGVFRNL